MLNSIYGLRLVANANLLMDGEPVQVPRTWRERLLSRPWRPWRATRTHIPKVPDDSIYRTPGTLIAHPVTIERIKAALAAAPSPAEDGAAEIWDGPPETWP